MEIIICYTTVPTMDIATTISNTLLSEKLIACSNCYPCKSHYKWEVKMEMEEEIIIHIKTTLGLISKVEKRISELHPYDTPAIIHWKVNVDLKYGQWVLQQVDNTI